MFSAVCAVAWLSSQDLRADLDALWQERDLKGATVGVLVKEVGGEVLYSKNPDRLLVPASLMKLATALFVLEALGPDYAPGTYAWREGETVYLWGGGDPGLSVQDLQVLAEVLPVQPTDKVVFDDSLFGPASRPPTWESRDFPYGYAAPIHSLTVEGGKVELWVEGTRAYLAPRNFGLQVETRIQKGSLEITVRDPSGGWSAGVAGVAPSPDPKKVATLSLPDPALSAGRVLHPKAKRGLAPDPPWEFLFLPAPPNISLSVDKRGRAVVGLRRRTVPQLLKTMLEQSDNVYAETLLRLTALKVGGARTWEDTLKVFSQFLRLAGVREGAFVLADGSGLSRTNRLSPRAVVTLLERGITREYSEVLVEGLAVPGEGTLKERLMGIPVACKTGTLSGVSCLAGILWQAPPRFFEAKKEPPLRVPGGASPLAPLPTPPYPPSSGSDSWLTPAFRVQGMRGLTFCIIIQAPQVPARRLREVQDALVTRLYQFLQAPAPLGVSVPAP